jgi:hypothetical protein
MPTARQLLVASKPAFASANTLLDASPLLGDLAQPAKEPAAPQPARPSDHVKARTLITDVGLSASESIVKSSFIGNEAAPPTPARKPELWLSNILFVTLLHVAAISIMVYYPFRWEVAVIMFMEYQIGMFG